MKGRACYRLEDILYRCPKCGQEFTLKGEGDTFKCTCGNGATVDDYYDFHPFEGSLIPKTPSEWVRWERINVIKEIRSDENYSYSEHVKLGRLPNDHYLKDYKTSEIVGEGMFTVDHSGVHYVDDKKAELNFDLDYKKIYTVITELDSSYFNFYVNGAYTDIFPEKQSMMKFNLLIEEMHRLHVNFYKNFKWNDYMYEEDALDKIEFIK